MQPEPLSRFDPADLGEETAPQVTVPAGPVTVEQRRLTARSVDRVVHLRIVLLLVASVLLFAVAVLLAHHSRRFDSMPVVVNGNQPTPVPVPHYSPPWIAAATAVAIVGAVLGTQGVVELVRMRWAAVRYDREHTGSLGH